MTAEREFLHKLLNALWCKVSHRNSQRRWREANPERHTFSEAQRRCCNPKNKDFDRYGARGIKFRFTSFEQFFAELGPRPSPQHSVDRIDNDGHYEPGNVRWATRSEQQRNRRDSIPASEYVKIRELWRQGRSMVYIARTLARSTASVHRVLREMNRENDR